MSKIFRQPRQTLAAATAAALLSTVPMAAQALVLAVSGSGVVQGPTPMPPDFSGLSIGPGNASYLLGGVTGWSIDVAFDGQLMTTEIDGNLAFGGWTGTMSGRFLRGGDSISFTGTQSSAGLEEPIALQYTVTGGTGLYAGYLGSGSSSVALVGNPFSLPTPVPLREFGGVLNLQPVPEPAAGR